MAGSAIVAVLADVAVEEVATAVLADVIEGAVVDTVVADAVGTVVADGLAAGLTDAAIATAADVAGATATEAALAGVGADVATATAVDAAAGAVADTALTGVDAAMADLAAGQGAVAPALEGVDAAMADLAAGQGAVVPESAVASVEVTPGGDIVNGVQTAENATGAVSPAETAGAGSGQPTTQIFDDGSTLTTAADGTVTSTAATDTGAIYDANGNRLVSPGGPGQAPVYDAAAGTPGAGAGTPDPSLGTALKDYASAVADTLGPAGLIGAGAVGAGLLSDALTPKLSGSVGSGGVNYEWGQGTPLVNPGLNPGFIGYAASMPDYQTTSPTQAQYYWGVHAPVNTAADLANYNQLPPGAPSTPWGLANSAVGGTDQFSPQNFVNQYILNPAWAGVMSGTSPGYTAPGPAVPVTTQH